MKHYSEEDLIAYQLGEAESASEIRKHLESCRECAAEADAVAETLRVFSAEAVPPVDVERSWQKVRGSLTVLEPAPKRGWFGLGSRSLRWPALGLAMAALIVMAGVFGLRFHYGAEKKIVRPNYAINGHGPLTTRPADPAIANHLDAAERLLTEVNHASGPLDDVTRTQAHQLLLKNAVYLQTAHDQGDVGEASVLDSLGRVLTSIDNSSDAKHSTLQLRLEMNTDGLLLNIRILRQNDEASQ
jgi:hypothetical protein